MNKTLLVLFFHSGLLSVPGLREVGFIEIVDHLLQVIS